MTSPRRTAEDIAWLELRPEAVATRPALGSAATARPTSSTEF